jgi:putative hydrolase of the HAD superfamily
MLERSSIRCLLIDLDDTLFPEWDFVVSGYNAIAKTIEGQTGIDAKQVINLLVYEHQKYGRRGVVDRVVENLGLAASLVPEFVDVYRNHAPVLRPYPGVVDTLSKLANRYNIAIITDGSATVQRRKVSALPAIASLVEKVVYCAELRAAKPSPIAFEFAMRAFNATPSETLIVGDDPYLDMRAAHSLGCPACRIRTGRYSHVSNPPESGVVGDLERFSAVEDWIKGETAFEHT